MMIIIWTRGEVLFWSVELPPATATTAPFFSELPFGGASRESRETYVQMGKCNSFSIYTIFFGPLET